MGWVRIDDAFYDHPKWIAAGPAGIGFWLTALAWSNRNLTDGYIPYGKVDNLCSFDGLSWETGGVPGVATFGEDVTGLAVAAKLCELGILEEADGGYAIHDYLEYQPSAAQITAKREREKERWHRRVERSPEQSAPDSTPEEPDPPPQPRKNSAATPCASQPQPQPQESELPDGSSARTFTKAQRDSAFDALVEVFGPARTKTSQGFYAKFALELLPVGDPSEIRRRGLILKEKGWPDCTPAALSKHWDQLGAPKTNGKQPGWNQ